MNRRSPTALSLWAGGFTEREGGVVAPLVFSPWVERPKERE